MAKVQIDYYKYIFIYYHDLKLELKRIQGKTKSLAIKLLSSAGTGFFYVTTKNPKNVTRKLELKKVRILKFIYLISNN
jgi:ribosomal protein L33